MLTAPAWPSGGSKAGLGSFEKGCALHASCPQYSTPKAAGGLCYNGRAVAHTGGPLLP